jgi:hypothetical protein
MPDVQHSLHAYSGLTYYQHHTRLQGSEAMVFALELVQTYWSINVTEPRFELPAWDQIQKLRLAMLTSQNSLIDSKGLEAQPCHPYQVSSDFTIKASSAIAIKVWDYLVMGLSSSQHQACHHRFDFQGMHPWDLRYIVIPCHLKIKKSWNWIDYCTYLHHWEIEYVERDMALTVLSYSAHMAHLPARFHQHVGLLRHLFLSSVEKEDHRYRPTVARCNPRVGQTAFNSDCWSWYSAAVTGWFVQSFHPNYLSIPCF